MRWLLCLGCLLLSAPAMAGAPIVAAASSLHFFLEEASERFTQQTGHTLRLNLGSSGNFRRQIAQGRPSSCFFPPMRASCKRSTGKGTSRMKA